MRFQQYICKGHVEYTLSHNIRLSIHLLCCMNNNYKIHSYIFGLIKIKITINGVGIWKLAYVHKITFYLIILFIKWYSIILKIEKIRQLFLLIKIRFLYRKININYLIINSIINSIANSLNSSRFNKSTSITHISSKLIQITWSM